MAEAVAGEGRLGAVGLWSMELRFGDKGEAAEAAAEMDELGYGALWMPGGIDDGVLGDVERLDRRHPQNTHHRHRDRQRVEAACRRCRRVVARAACGVQARVMLGLGVSHGPFIGETWAKPLKVMRDYLDGLDAEGLPRERPVPGGAGAEDDRNVGRAHRRVAPLSHHAGTHCRGARDPGTWQAARARTGGGARDRSRSRRAISRGLPSDTTWVLPELPQLVVATGFTQRRRSTPLDDRLSTRFLLGGRPSASPNGSRRTAMPGPTMSASS